MFATSAVLRHKQAIWKQGGISIELASESRLHIHFHGDQFFSHAKIMNPTDKLFVLLTAYLAPCQIVTMVIHSMSEILVPSPEVFYSMIAIFDL